MIEYTQYVVRSFTAQGGGDTMVALVEVYLIATIVLIIFGDYSKGGKHNE